MCDDGQMSPHTQTWKALGSLNGKESTQILNTQSTSYLSPPILRPVVMKCIKVLQILRGGFLLSNMRVNLLQQSLHAKVCPACCVVVNAVMSHIDKLHFMLNVHIAMIRPYRLPLPLTASRAAP